MARKKTAAPATKPGDLTKYQAFTVERLHRSKIANAQYNPRTISPAAKAKLEKKLRSSGLLQPLVWNRRSGNLVSGHQRLAALDALEGHADYTMDVSVVDLSPKQERQENIFFNNTAAMGDWDLDLLADMFRDDAEVSLEWADAGFDRMDVELMFTDEKFSFLFDEENVPEPVKEAVADLEEAKQLAAEEKRKERIDKRRADPNVKSGFYGEDQQNRQLDCYTVLVFPSREACDAFNERIGIAADDRYAAGPAVREALNEHAEIDARIAV